MDDFKLSPEREARIAALDDAFISRKTWRSPAYERELAEAEAAKRAAEGPKRRFRLRFWR